MSILYLKKEEEEEAFMQYNIRVSFYDNNANTLF